MPELPDLLYIQRYLTAHITGRSITTVTIKQPVVLRVAVQGDPEQLLVGKTIEDVALHGPFIQFLLSGETELVLNLMLAGRLQHQKPEGKPEGYLCLSLGLDDNSHLNLCDDQLMAKVYLVRKGDHEKIPRFREQGANILSQDFSRELFSSLLKKHSRKQVRVFINDQTILSAIGNAYADEILFEARIHPKTFVARLTPEERTALYNSISSVLTWAATEVDRAGQLIQKKVRDHLRVRNRHGQPCPRCGTTIRREGVRGHDVFFCPSCQPPSRRLFIDWEQH